LAGLLLFVGIPATSVAQAPGVTTLRRKSAEIERRSRAAVLDLYALGTRLDQTRTELARLDARLTALRRQQASAREEYRVALATQTRAEAQLGAQLRLLYEQDDADPIAVILGAATLEEAVEGLDNIKRIAHATESVVAQAEKARGRVSRERKELAAQVARTDGARARTAAETAELERARVERSAYLAQLRAEQQLNATQIVSVERQATEAQKKAQQVTAQAREHPLQQTTSTAAVPTAAAPATSTAAVPSASPPPDATPAPAQTTTFETPSTAAPGEPPPAAVESVSQSSSSATAGAPGPPRKGGTMTVLVTAYCLTGSTATGLPVGPGIVAVDPSVIPLGTRMSIPGYGDGVAADVGSAVKGAHIDVWIASCSAAAAFARNVTITFL
jgi:cystine transport system substrate-binding protein